MSRSWDSKEFDNSVQSSKKITLADFYTQSCGPCKKISPDIEKLAKDYKDVLRVYKIDAEDKENDGEEIAEALKVECYPTFIFFYEGKEQGRVEGADLDEIKEKLKKIISKKLGTKKS